MSLAGRVKNGTAAGILRQGIMIGSELMLVPILLMFWGQRLYGEWQVLSAAMVYITMLDLGTHTYAANRMNQAYASGNLPELIRTLHTALGCAIAAGLIGMSIAVGFAQLLPLSDWFHLEVTSDALARRVLLLLAVQTALAFPVGVLAGIYRAVGEYARDVMVSNVYRTSVWGGTTAIVVSGGSILEIALIQLVLYIGVLIYIVTDIRARHPAIHLGIGKFDRHLILTFLVPSLLFFFIQMSASAAIQGAILIVAATAGAGAVAVFTITRTLVNAIPQTVNSVSGTLWPEFTAMEARKELDRLGSIHQLAAKVILWLTVTSAVFLHYTASDIISIWTGSRIQPDQRLVDVLLLLEVSVGWSLASQTLLAAANRPRLIALCQLVGTFAGLGAGYLCALRWGSAGVAVGLLAMGLLSTACVLPIAACRLLRYDLSIFTREVLGRGIVILAILAAGVGLAARFLPLTSGVARIFSIWLATGVMGALFLRFLWLTRMEWDLLKTFLPESVMTYPSRAVSTIEAWWMLQRWSVYRRGVRS